MERIGVLINKLLELYQQKASADQIVHVVQMLHKELLLLKQQEQVPERKKIAVMMPPAGVSVSIIEQALSLHVADNRKEVAGTFARQDAEEEEEEEETAVRPLKNGTKQTEIKTAPGFNVLEDVPTLAHQPQVKELNEVIGKSEPSINDRLFEQKTELAEKLKEEPLKDFKKAVGVNDRFIFISELFRGDEDMYERSLKTINRFTIYPEAEFWISRELKLKLGWNDDHPAVKQFDQLVRRRFL